MYKICFYSPPEKDNGGNEFDDVKSIGKEEDNESANDSEGLDANVIYNNWKKLGPGTQLPR